MTLPPLSVLYAEHAKKMEMWKQAIKRMENALEFAMAHDLDIDKVSAKYLVEIRVFKDNIKFIETLIAKREAKEYKR